MEVLDPIVPSIQAGKDILPFNPTDVLIWGIALKKPTKVLIDTGAAVTVISGIYYSDMLWPLFELKSNIQLASVKTASENSLPVTGLVSSTVVIGQLEYQCDASVVSGLAYNIILGRDFVHNFSTIIYVGGQTVQFSGNNVVYFATGNAPPHESEVKFA